ncbi:MULTISPECIES: TonB-dependent receptor domain-containing protein [unclassified Sphingomonas]|uniref:TonB-dependent receptor domain-containing protein n=1 Tax=unclassified Sphingomonas TaxID=196159 RepID=UPI0021518607|nr:MULTISPECIES: TonB-dependent receptor [unclassified Sphingomonas]MCR5869648.1 TonB-dependent receptor [Sphingomonas sp. J344]UUX98640.1 TonB-dependent receptor [Sphingomonas sp. J315]
MKKQLLAACGVSALVLGGAAPAFAQDSDGETEIVITGSIIAGTPEDAALPVDVIGAEELAKQGNPTVLDLVKALPSSSASLGDANQFDSRSQGAEGIATVNLRGLSPQRTLVLLNSKRLATSGNGVPSVDINLLPQAAIGRVEVLKDGAAATYGSEAIAGVVNFITRTNQRGFQGSGSYRFIEGSDGDFDVSLSFGHVGDNFRLLVAGGYQQRGQLMAKDRDWAVRPYPENPQGGWTGGGNPANFLFLGATGSPVTGIVADTACAPLGGYVGADARCYNQYSTFDNLVEKEMRGQAFIDFEWDVGENTTFQMTALYGRTTVPNYLSSPSYLLTQPPSGVAIAGTPFAPFAALLNSGFFVPSANPGLVAYRAANTTPAGAGVLFPTLLFRPHLLGGNPSTLDNEFAPGSATGLRKGESTRFTAELRGEVADGLNYNLNATYHNYYRYIDGYDSFGDRVQRALLGFGGASCTGTTPGANGCLWLNPFGNAVSVNPATGQTNPGANGPTNSAELTDWFFVKSHSAVTTDLLVFEGSLSGGTGFNLPGGEVQFGVGAQYRDTSITGRYGANNNLAQNPCRETPLNGNTNAAACSGGRAAAGALGFLGTNLDYDLQGDVWALFAEAQLPILDTLNLQLAARFEDYGGATGSTFDPQIRARWQVTDWLAVRGGFGTTFRAPTLNQLAPGSITALQIIDTTFRPIDVFGNPNLVPESSKNYGAGVLLSAGGFSASIDYYRYDIEDAIVSDPLISMVNTLFPSTGGNTCATNAALAARFTFSTGPCTATTARTAISRVRTETQNGASITNEGIDVMASYRGTDMLGSGTRFAIGGNVTYTLQNRISDIFVAGALVQGGYDGVGLLNYQTTLYPVPEWKGQGFLEFGAGPIDARLTATYIDGLYDQRADTTTAGVFGPNPALGGARVTQGAFIDSFTTVDFTIQFAITDSVTLSGSVYNLFDQDPPFAREDYNYEPFVGNPLGRNFKVGVSAKF